MPDTDTGTPRQPIIIALPQFPFWKRKSAQRREELRQRVNECLQEMQRTEAGRAAMSQGRPIIVIGRLPRQWWGALTWRPLILVNPAIVEKPGTAVEILSHEYGHYLFQTSVGSRIIDSLDQEYSAEYLKASIWVERYGREDPPYYEQAGWILDESVKSAHESIRKWGNFYALLSEKQPRWYEVKKWWPVIRYWLIGK